MTIIDILSILEPRILLESRYFQSVHYPPLLIPHCPVYQYSPGMYAKGNRYSKRSAMFSALSLGLRCVKVYRRVDISGKMA